MDKEQWYNTTEYSKQATITVINVSYNSEISSGKLRTSHEECSINFRYRIISLIRCSKKFLILKTNFERVKILITVVGKF